MSQVSDDFAVVSPSTGGTEVRIRFNLVNAEAGARRRSGADDTRRACHRSGLSPSMSVA
jgi:hypothetical protein